MVLLTNNCDIVLLGCNAYCYDAVDVVRMLVDSTIVYKGKSLPVGFIEQHYYFVIVNGGIE